MKKCFGFNIIVSIKKLLFFSKLIIIADTIIISFFTKVAVTNTSAILIPSIKNIILIIRYMLIIIYKNGEGGMLKDIWLE